VSRLCLIFCRAVGGAWSSCLRGTFPLRLNPMNKLMLRHSCYSASYQVFYARLWLCESLLRNLSSVVGQFVPATSTRPFSNRSTGAFGSKPSVFTQGRESREIAAENGRRLISQLAGSVGVDSSGVDNAVRNYRIALEQNFVQGRRAIVVAAVRESRQYGMCFSSMEPVLCEQFGANRTVGVSFVACFIRRCACTVCVAGTAPPTCCSTFPRRFA
jgi:hypothetical protein